MQYQPRRGEVRGPILERENSAVPGREVVPLVVVEVTTETVQGVEVSRVSPDIQAVATVLHLHTYETD